MLIDVNHNDTFEHLKQKIVEHLGDFSLVDHFRDLTGLRVLSMEIFNKNKKKPLPDYGLITDEIKDGDLIQFSVTSQDIWIKIYMTMISTEKVHKSTFEVRVNREMDINSFKAYIQKSVILIWNQIKTHNLKDITFYFLDSVKIVKYNIFQRRSKNERNSFSQFIGSSDVESEDDYTNEDRSAMTSKLNITGQ